MRLGELCTREVVVVGRDESVQAASRLMRDHHAGDVVVVEERQGRRVPVGILTDRDIAVEVVALEVDPHQVSVADVMSADLVSLGSDADLFEATSRMRQHGVRRLVVTEGEALVGLVSLDDAIDLLAEEMSNLARVSGREREVEAHRRQRP